jgi:MSHA biogenesis protein MshJ
MKYLRLGLKWFKAISRREQVLFVFVVCVVLIAGAHLLVLAPLAKSNTSLQFQIESDRNDLKAALITKRAAEERARASASAERAQLDQTKSSGHDVEAKLNEILVDRGTAELLRSEALAAGGLTLKSFRSFPTTIFFESTPAEGGRPTPDPAAATASERLVVYRHAAEIAVQGKYFDLLAFMRKIQNANPGLFWSDTRLEVAGYPEAVLTVTVYRLSTRQVLPLS